MEQTFRQLQFNFGLLAALRTGLTRVMRWHLMEVFAIALGNPVAPVKEHAPRRIGNRLGEVSVLDHIAGFKFLSNDRIEIFVVKKLVGGFCDKVKALTCNNICLFRQSVFRLIPASAPIRLARKVALKFHEFLFRLSIKARVGYLLTPRVRQIRLYSHIHTTSGCRNTRHRVRHFTHDEAIPPPRRLFERDLFRVSDKRTVLADFHFTEFWHFQTVIPSACFTDRVLTNTDICVFILNFVFSQVPRQRTDRTLELRISFFLRTFATSATEVFMCRVSAFDRRDLHILWMLGIVRGGGAECLQMVDLVIHRHRLATIVPHLRTHLEHVVLELLLVFQLRKKPLLLHLCRRYRIFECAFHNVFTSHVFNPFQVGRQTHNLAIALEMSANVILYLYYISDGMSNIFWCFGPFQ